MRSYGNAPLIHQTQLLYGRRDGKNEIEYDQRDFDRFNNCEWPIQVLQYAGVEQTECYYQSRKLQGQ